MQTVHLQGIGQCKAIPARELQPGMERLFNYGFIGTIISVESRGEWIHVQVAENGKVYRKRHKADTLIPLAS